MKKTVVLLLSVLLLTVSGISAFAATESGYLSGPGASYSFSAYGPADVTFSWPRGSVDFWVTVAAPSGAVNNFDLDNGEIIQLPAAGMYTLTIYSKSGAGNWSASWGGGGGGAAPGNCNVGDKSAWGYLSGPNDSCSFSLDSYVSNLSVSFSTPGGASDFWVEIVGKDERTVLANYDLNTTNNIQLQGGGMFYLTIYSNRGAGNWSCTW